MSDSDFWEPNPIETEAEAGSDYWEVNEEAARDWRQAIVVDTIYTRLPAPTQAELDANAAARKAACRTTYQCPATLADLAELRA